MNNKKALVILGIAIVSFLSLFSLGAIFVSMVQDNEDIVVPVSKNLSSLTDSDFVNLTLPNGTIINAEVAKSPEKRTIGLMNREFLETDYGMLFIFENEDYRTFWMKNTLVSLDIIFLDSNLKVVDLYQSTKPNQITEVYPSKAKAIYVLEIEAQNEPNIKVGNKLFVK